MEKSRTDFKKTDYPINPDICKKCKYRKIGNHYYLCNYMTITDKLRDTSEDNFNHCGCFEKKVKNK